MARTNKFTSINFNHILEKSNNNSNNTNAVSNNTNAVSNNTKQQSSSSSSSSSYSSIASPGNPNHISARTHGRMLVLSRPTPKPIATTTAPLSPQPIQKLQDKTRPEPERTGSEPAGSDPISLRPLGRTGTDSPAFCPVLAQEKDKEVGSIIGSPKPDKFVPPHLRPGFLRREERPGPEVVKGLRPVRVGEEERPKSGGGYDKRMRGGGGGGGGGREPDLGLLSRPRSSGNCPSSSGWYECDSFCFPFPPTYELFL